MNVIGGTIQFAGRLPERESWFFFGGGGKGGEQIDENIRRTSKQRP